MNPKAPPKSLLGSLAQGFKTPANQLDWLVLGFMAAKWAYTKYNSQRLAKADTVLRFSSDDQPFHWLMRWLEKMPRQKELACFKVLPKRAASPDDNNQKAMLVPTEGVGFKYRGVDCWLQKVSEPEGPQNIGSFMRPQVEIRLRTRDMAIAEAFIHDIAAAAHEKEPAKVYVLESWGAWVPVRTVPEGRVAILPEGQVDAVIDDVHSFLASERWYQSAGLPYRRGYLLEGIPGSGKTSLVLAIAAELDMNVGCLGLSGIDDKKLAEVVRNLPNNTILLLEDIDCAWDGREAKDKVTFSGLLNVIDGAATPDGRLTFLTTNHRHKLDAALIRPGRVDYEMNFTHATANQIDEMASRFTSLTQGYGQTWGPENISMADVQERLLKLYRPKVSA